MGDGYRNGYRRITAGKSRLTNHTHVVGLGVSTEHPVSTDPYRQLSWLTPRVGIGALVLTQAVDVLTTLIALHFVPAIEEMNVVAASVIETFGLVVGLTAAAAVSVGGLVLVTEFGASIVRDHTADSQRLVAIVRLIGYGPMTVINVGVALHNALLFAAVCCPS